MMNKRDKKGEGGRRVTWLGEVLHDMWFHDGHFIELVEQRHGEVTHADAQHTPFASATARCTMCFMAR